MDVVDVVGGSEVDGFEESARIVEAFSHGEDPKTVELLERIAEAIRDHAIDA